MAARGLLMDVVEGSEPPASGGAGSSDAIVQCWRGGVVDRATRAARAGSVCAMTLVDLPVPAGRDDQEAPRAALASWDLEQIVPSDEPSPHDARGLVIVSMDVDPAVEDEFNDWYTTEHIPLLRQVEGVLTARRFRASRGAPKYVSIYHLDDAARYASPVWLAANKTPWMRRMRRFQQNRTYFIFDERLAT
ncbi:DUF4286 family protein [Lutibaculum baratangense]|uniref:EthD domain-containing protein n=1 Tax=Lutibaculum baratangense AMV1 TaxID=631454 RepID=V4REG7_9HYPH|nr:DUF4286 family protein [Lutibaculum baratangense]ESR23784.1 hypothetical protein N177_3014 [Lutibaculum baratangense AMV1]